MEIFIRGINSLKKKNTGSQCSLSAGHSKTQKIIYSIWPKLKVTIQPPLGSCPRIDCPAAVAINWSKNS
ncbi:hypothetical protein, partial [Endozoicomonas sp. ONNA2]|uniref:hypothetical protein n=1 Tax=Endozoicomonas sp. ONNA2 TaxID=2828741 RepID=UPI002148D1BE